MVRHTDADRDFDDMDTDDLAAYINRVAPVAANLPDGEHAEPVLTANAEAAIAEFRDRHGITVDDTDHLTGDDRDPTEDEVAWGDTVDDFEDAVADAVATDGGKDPVEAEADDEWVGHLEPDTGDVKIRHDQSIRTVVEDGVVVHKVVEQYDDTADAASLGFTGGYTCPDPDHDITTEYDGDVIRHTCDGDECPFEAAVGYRPTPDDVTNHKTPSWYRVTVPHDTVFEHGVDDDFDPAEWVDDADEDDKADTARIVRRLALSRFVVGVRDDAHVSAEYDGDPLNDDDAEKVADAYIDTFECARCGAEHDVGAERSHPAEDDPVCDACKDDPEWSIDDADVPDDVEDTFDAYGSVTPGKFRDLLRDVKHYPAWVAAGDDDTDVDDAPACPTGKQGERRVKGHGSPGTGLRRPDGVAHGDSNWRVVLREARDAGLIHRVDDEDDAAFDDAPARWESTDKGDAAFAELARCEWCGKRRHAYRHKYTVKLSRWNTTTNVDLIAACPDRCRTDLRGSTTDLTTDE